MALSDYTTQTYRYLQNPGSAGIPLYPSDAITNFINRARKQIAGESESARNYGTIQLAVNTRAYNFSAITFSPSTGIEGAANVRQALVNLGAGSVWMSPRPFEWFTLYHLNDVVPPSGLPTEWSQYSQGETGSFYVSPLPDQAYVASVDCIGYPIDLVDDTTVEIIPYPWTDCVPILAAYYALLSAQRLADAQAKYDMYKLFANRARSMSNPDAVPNAYSQPPQDQTMSGRLGVKPGRQQQ